MPTRMETEAHPGWVLAHVTQWVERHGEEAREKGCQRGPSTCLELWVHCLVVCERTV